MADVELEVISSQPHIEVQNVTGLRGPRGPAGSEADLAAHEAAADPHAAARYAIMDQSSPGRTIFVQMQGDDTPTNMVDGDILIREISSGVRRIILHLR